MNQDEVFINGDLLRLRREERGWVLNDMATRACMSVKQIRQLEEGGISSFYSTAVKITAAKKVGALLGLSSDEVFAATTSPEAVATSEEVTETVEDVTESSQTVEVSPQPESTLHHDSASLDSVQASNDVVTEIQATPASAETPKSKTSFATIAILFLVALAAAAYLQPKEEAVVEPAPPVQVLPADATDPASAASAAEQAASSIKLFSFALSASRKRGSS